MNPRRMQYLLVLCIVGIIFIAGAAVYIANGKLTKIALDTSRLSADIEVNRKKIQTYSITQSQVESLGYVEDLAAKVLPDDQEQSAVVTEISNFALRSKLTLAGIDFVEMDAAAKSKNTKTKTAVPKGVAVVPVVVTFKEASYSGLLDFLRTVETTQRKAQVSSINLTPDAKNRAVLSEVAVAINLYTKKPAGNAK
ncbi:MAG: hypothetical protein U0520_02455 [Candidatus Saccharimonadales bacterium]